MTIGEIIEFLNKYEDYNNLHAVFSNPHSWRGDYRELAIEQHNRGVGEKFTVQDFRILLKGCIGETFIGYKGGEFTMHESTEVYLDSYGSGSGNVLGRLNLLVITQGLELND